ncbi:MAG: hypothetical protein AB7I41_14685 [Candidatus Sericytochromatia bacterium]
MSKFCSDFFELNWPLSFFKRASKPVLSFFTSESKAVFWVASCSFKAANFSGSGGVTDGVSSLFRATIVFWQSLTEVFILFNNPGKDLSIFE